MRSPIAAAALLLGLGACTPALRPPAVSAVPRAHVGGSFGAPSAGEGYAENTGDADWADDALGRPGAVRGDAPTAEEVRAALEAAPMNHWDIDVLPFTTHERVAHFVDIYSGPARQRFAERLRRGTRYEPMIRAKLRAGGLPEDLFYLALVESGFDEHAYSRAAAVGMWQFMTTTGRGAGLRIDWWVDERRDPVRATDAAIRHLRDLRRSFDGSTYLAAAAYNGGSGRVSRGLAQHAAAVGEADGEGRFFALAGTGYLRDETRDYVPQIIAAALVAKSPSVYGLLVDSLPPLAYDSARVAGGTPLAAIAEASSATLAEVLELNGQFLRGVTPPGEPSLVRLPAGRGAGFADRLAALPESRRVGLTRVRTSDNGRLSRLAAEHGTSEARLAAFNPGLRRNKRGLLVGGQTVLVPSAAVFAGARDVPDPSIERYGTTPGTPPPTVASTRAPERRAPRTYTVKAGDALERIARAHDLSVARLRALNDLGSSTIRPGQVLVVEVAGAGAPSSRSARTGSAKSGKKGAARAASGGKTRKAAAVKTTKPAKPAGKRTTSR